MNSDRSPLHRLSRIAVTGVTVVVAGAALTLAPATASTPDDRGGHGGHGGHEHGGDWPEVIALPDGFQPEGIAIAEDRHGWGHGGHGGWSRGGHGGGHDHGHDADQAFLGSRADGDIWTVDLSTGEGHLVAEGPGTPSLGMKVDRQGRLFVAGGTGGDGRVVDIESGETLAEYPFTSASSFVNDVVLTRGGAWFTDSSQAQLYLVPWSDHDGDDCRGGGHCRGGHEHGDDLPAPEDVETLPLTGDWTQPAGFGANGIAMAPDGRSLVIVNSSTGQLFRVDPRTGVALLVDLGGATVANGDGLLLVGDRTLLVVQNQLNQIAVVRLDRHATSGTVTRTITSENFDIPTTVARSGSRLYLPNARFTTTPTPTTTYDVTAVRLWP